MTKKTDRVTRRGQITQAALELAGNRGLRGVKMAQLGIRLGIVPSAMYRHFKNKGEILDAVMDIIEQRLMKNVAAVREKTTDPMERLRLLLMRHAGMISDNQGLQRIIFSEEVFCGRPERRRRLDGIISGYLGQVSDIIKQGQREGRIKRDIDSGTAAMLFLGLIQPAVIRWQLSDGRFEVIRHARKAWKMFRGILES